MTTVDKQPSAPPAPETPKVQVNPLHAKLEALLKAKVPQIFVGFKEGGTNDSLLLYAGMSFGFRDTLKLTDAQQSLLSWVHHRLCVPSCGEPKEFGINSIGGRFNNAKFVSTLCDTHRSEALRVFHAKYKTADIYDGATLHMSVSGLRGAHSALEHAMDVWRTSQNYKDHQTHVYKVVSKSERTVTLKALDVPDFEQWARHEDLWKKFQRELAKQLWYDGADCIKCYPSYLSLAAHSIYVGYQVRAENNIPHFMRHSMLGYPRDSDYTMPALPAIVTAIQRSLFESHNKKTVLAAYRDHMLDLWRSCGNKEFDSSTKRMSDSAAKRFDNMSCKELETRIDRYRDTIRDNQATLVEAYTRAPDHGVRTEQLDDIADGLNFVGHITGALDKDDSVKILYSSSGAEVRTNHANIMDAAVRTSARGRGMKLGKASRKVAKQADEDDDGVPSYPALPSAANMPPLEDVPKSDKEPKKVDDIVTSTLTPPKKEEPVLPRPARAFDASLNRKVVERTRRPS